MKRSRFRESQLVAVLKEGDAGMPVANCVVSTVLATPHTTSSKVPDHRSLQRDWYTC